jgi:hypothetical protein
MRVLALLKSRILLDEKDDSINFLYKKILNKTAEYQVVAEEELTIVKLIF